jgi:hypothetical protein
MIDKANYSIIASVSNHITFLNFNYDEKASFSTPQTRHLA